MVKIANDEHAKAKDKDREKGRGSEKRRTEGG